MANQRRWGRQLKVPCPACGALEHSKEMGLCQAKGQNSGGGLLLCCDGFGCV